MSYSPRLLGICFRSSKTLETRLGSQTVERILDQRLSTTIHPQSPTYTCESPSARLFRPIDIMLRFDPDKVRTYVLRPETPRRYTYQPSAHDASIIQIRVQLSLTWSATHIRPPHRRHHAIPSRTQSTLSRRGQLSDLLIGNRPMCPKHESDPEQISQAYL